MCGRIPKYSKKSLQQIREAALLAFLGVSRERVDAKARRIATQCLIHQDGAVTHQSCFTSQLFTDTLTRLKHGMKDVLLNELRTASVEHVGMNSARRQSRPKPIGSRFSLGKCGCGGYHAESTIRPELK